MGRVTLGENVVVNIIFSPCLAWRTNDVEYPSGLAILEVAFDTDSTESKVLLGQGRLRACLG